MTNEERIKALRAEIEALEKEATKPKRANDIGPVALQKITSNLDLVRVNLANLDLEHQDEKTIMTELRQINYASYTGMRALEQDLTERGQ